MKRIILANLVALLAVVSATAGEFKAYINDFAIAADETRSIFLKFANTEEIYSMQFDLQLPEGLEVTDDDWENYPDVLGADRVPTRPQWNIDAAYINNNRSHIRVTFTNTRNWSLPVGEGSLFEIVVHASADFAGPATGTVSGVVVTNVDQNPVEPAGTSFDVCVSVPLADIVASGEDDTKYFISNAVAVVDYSVENGFAIVAADKDNWMRVEAPGDVIAAIGEAGGVAASTLGGTLSDAQRNQVLTLTSDPVATEEYPSIDIATKDLAESFEFPANAVVTFKGYYFVENGVPTLRASVKANKETGSKGQSLTLDLSWMDGEFEFSEAAKYQIKGVVQLKEAWSGAPRRAPRSSYDYDFQNYTLSPLRSSDITVVLPTAVTDVETAKPAVSVVDGTITVDGASLVDVYSLDGRAVSATPGAGVYVVVADGVATKVVVR